MKRLIFIVMTLMLAGCAAAGSAPGSQSEIEQSIDFVEGVIDEELYLTISNFEELP